MHILKGKTDEYLDRIRTSKSQVILSPYSSAVHQRFGGKLDLQYKGTPNEKEISATGVTTEFIRCIDPTASGIVVRVIRTRVK
jgi:hypothetical protein